MTDTRPGAGTPGGHEPGGVVQLLRHCPQGGEARPLLACLSPPTRPGDSHPATDRSDFSQPAPFRRELVFDLQPPQETGCKVQAESARKRGAAPDTLPPLPQAVTWGPALRGRHGGSQGHRAGSGARATYEDKYTQVTRWGPCTRYVKSLFLSRVRNGSE